MHAQLEASKAANAVQTELVASLQAQPGILQVEATTAENLEAIHISGDVSAASAEAEHTALIQEAKADLEIIKTEPDTREGEHDQALAAA